MNRTLLSRLIIVSLIFTPEIRAKNPTAEDIEWIRRHAVVVKTCQPGQGFEDLQPLRTLVGDSRVVSLGECSHGTREVFQMKHRLVEFLASEMGFTIFSIEANMPEAYRVNEFASGGHGDVDELIRGMGFWTWETEEIKDLILWMRAFNLAGMGHIEFTGFDMQTPDMAMEIVVDYLRRVDAEQHLRVKDIYEVCKNAYSMEVNFYGVDLTTFPMDAVKGKKLRLTGWIRTERVARAFAGLWCRVDGKGSVLAYDDMKDHGVQGTTEWTEYAIELDVPNTAVDISLGVFLGNDGKAWFDGLNVLINGKPDDATKNLDLDFEGESFSGSYSGGSEYSVTLDGRVAQSGKKSLRMEHVGSVGGPAASSIHAADAARQCGKVAMGLLLSRERYAKVTSGREADWALQNSRLVQQSLQMRAKEVHRDECMARNVKWILDQAPPDTKIILWAHNGHVSRNRIGLHGSMGTFLNEWYGKKQLVVGFAVGEGNYTAMVRNRGLSVDNRLQSPVAGSLEDFFRQCGPPLFMVNLRHIAPDTQTPTWLKSPTLIRSIGATAILEQFDFEDVIQAYDAMVYIDQTTASRPLSPVRVRR